ncbi:MAG: DnaD domain protein, partial [Porticoccaceae bacterium]
MYQARRFSGDAVMVPQLLFSKLAASGARENHFRVALYLLSAGPAEAGQIAAALHLKEAEVERALAYWEGAGLIEQDQPAQPVAQTPQRKRRLTVEQTVRAGEADPQLGFMLAELQRVYGGVVGPKPTSVFASLYVQEGYAPDLILLAASYAAAKGISSAAYVEAVLTSWRKNGIDNCTAADRHLRQMAEREEREKEL